MKFFFFIINKHKKLSGSPHFHANFGHQRTVNNILYTWPAVCTVEIINTWRQAGLSRSYVELSENTEQIENTETHRVVTESSRLKIGIIYSDSMIFLYSLYNL